MLDEQEISKNVAEEKAVVAEVERHIGTWPWEFKKIAFIPTDQAKVADAVLPILAARLAAGVRPSTRSSIYQKMATPYAGPYIDLLLAQLLVEPHGSDEMQILMPALVYAAGDADIPRVWSALRGMRAASFRWWDAVGALANRRTAPAEVGAVLRQALDEGNHGFYVYEDMASVRDRRVRDWFTSHLDSKDRDLARLARRVVAKHAKRPAAVFLPATAPVRESAIESSEIDWEDAPQLFHEWKSSLGLKLPRWLQTARGLEFLDVDQWASLAGCGKSLMN